jgi:hypothetical protein
MKGAIARAQELVAATPGAWMPQQFENPANIDVHVRTTAQEILADFPEGLDALITGVGTGGHITGCAQVLKAKWPQLKVFAVEPAASPVISGGSARAAPDPGHRRGFHPEEPEDRAARRRDPGRRRAAREMARRCAREEGMLVGISSGATLAAIAQKLPELPAGTRVLGFNYDTGERYLSIEGFLPTNSSSRWTTRRRTWTPTWCARRWGWPPRRALCGSMFQAQRGRPQGRVAGGLHRRCEHWPARCAGGALLQRYEAPAHRRRRPTWPTTWWAVRPTTSPTDAVVVGFRPLRHVRRAAAGANGLASHRAGARYHGAPAHQGHLGPVAQERCSSPERTCSLVRAEPARSPTASSTARSRTRVFWAARSCRSSSPPGRPRDSVRGASAYRHLQAGQGGGEHARTDHRLGRRGAL